MKTHLKCPWCGLTFENGKDLNNHAKGHYVETIVAYNEELTVVTV
jgi:hypothetical protein